METVLRIFDISLLIVLPFVVGALVGWLIRHGRIAADARLKWNKPVHEQIEDMITFGIAFGLGALVMVLGGVGYVWWFFNYFVLTYPAMALVQSVQIQPILLMGYWAFGYFVSHMAAWFYHQGGVSKKEEE